MTDYLLMTDEQMNLKIDELLYLCLEQLQTHLKTTTDFDLRKRIEHRILEIETELNLV